MDQVTLYTFGCSFTYGTGLPDCWAGDYRGGVRASRLAWPHKLRNLMRIPNIKNLSKSGSSNKRIAFTALNNQYQSHDTVVFLWSMPGRDTIFNQPFEESWDLFPASNDAYKQIKDYQRHIANSTDYSIYVTEYMYINLADNHVRRYTDNVYHFAVPETYAQYQFDWNRVELIDYANLVFTKHGPALDGAHPNEAAHVEWATVVYKHIKSRQDQATGSN